MRRTALIAALSVGILVACQRAPAESGDPLTGAVSQVEVEYLAHASFLVRSPDGVELLLDPYASRVWLGYDFPDGISPAAVLITHPHYDHDAGRYRGAAFPWGGEVRVVDGPGRVELGDVTILGVAGKHADPYGMEFGQLNTIMVVEVGGLRLAHLGDNGPLTPEMLEGMGQVDVLFLPADGVDHILSKEETQAIIDSVSPVVVIPMHYRLADLELSPDSPSDLGDLEPWLEGRDRVVRIGSHVRSLSQQDLPSALTYWVFEHAPYIEPPESN